MKLTDNISKISLLLYILAALSFLLCNNRPISRYMKIVAPYIIQPEENSESNSLQQ